MGTKATDKSAFDTIYENNVGSVYQTALRYSGNHHAAEEITQTVFMKLYINLENVNEKAVNSWLLTTAKHIALNHKRKLKKEVLKEKIDILYEGSDKLPAVSSSEEEFINRLYARECKDLTESIFTDLCDLNPKWYDAITITYLLEKPQKEVADMMGVKLEVLHSMLYRAKKWIRKNYQTQYDHLRKE